MTTSELILWVGSFAAAYVLLYCMQLPLRSKDKWLISLISFIVKLLVATGMAYFSLGGPVGLPHIVNNLIGLLYIVFFGDAALDLVIMVMALLKKEFRSVPMLISGLVLTMAYMAYAILNMQITVPKYHEYKSDKVTGEHKIVFLTDLHYGSAQTRGSVLRTLDKIREENPDFILLGGDITDEYSSAADMEYIYEQLGKLDVPVYFIYGNHDRKTAGEEKLVKTITDNGLIILKDEVVLIGDDMALLGRDDYSSEDRMAVEDLPEVPSDRYVICVDHSPYQYDDITADGADLQLSGHVHAGQLFPLQFIYGLAVNNVYGDFRYDSTDLYVTSGVSGWCYPLRTEEHSNYEVITITSVDGNT